jgi:hypothetical protein
MQHRSLACVAVGLVVMMAALVATAGAGCANIPRSGWHKQYSLNFTNNDYQHYFRLQYSWNDHNPAGQQRHFALGRVGVLCVVISYSLGKSEFAVPIPHFFTHADWPVMTCVAEPRHACQHD